MSDFGELCPLFNTGVFHELTFANMTLSQVSLTSNVLAGTGAPTAAYPHEYFTFGRTVVITEAWVKRMVANTKTLNMDLLHWTSKSAAGTIFGTIYLSITVSNPQLLYGWGAFTITDPKTFTSTDILALQLSNTLASGNIDLMIRYRDK